MTRSPPAIPDEDLHAFVDGQLDGARRREVSDYLVAHPEGAARAVSYQAQNEGLHALFDSVLSESVPAALKPPAVARRFVPLAWAAAAALAMFLAGGSVGWYYGTATGTGAPEAIALARQAAVAHAVFTPQKRHPVEVTGEEEAHLVAWLSKVLGAPLRAPRLTEFGYSLVGGRLLTAEDGPAAQFMYESPDGTRLTLYVVADARWKERTEFRYGNIEGVPVFYWIEGPLGFAIASETERPRLRRLVRAVYSQLFP